MSSKNKAEKDFVGCNKGFIEAIIKELSNKPDNLKVYIPTYNGSSKPNIIMWGDETDSPWVQYTINTLNTPELISLQLNAKASDPYRESLDAFLKEQEVFDSLYANRVKKFMEGNNDK